MKTAEAITNKIISEFDKEAGPKLRDQLIQGEKAQAKREAEAVNEAVANRERPRYSSYTKKDKDGVWRPNLELAEQRGIRSYEGTRNQFRNKIAGKLHDILGDREGAAKFDISMYAAVPVRCKLTVEHKGVKFHASLELKYNCRYTPRYTPYYQYPFRISCLRYADTEKGSICPQGPYSVEMARELLDQVDPDGADKPKETTETTIEPTKENLKALDSLIWLLINKERLEQRAQEARRRNRYYGKQGPDAQISRNCNKLGLPKTITQEQAEELLAKTLPADAQSRLAALATAEGGLPQAKRGSPEAALDKLLKYLDWRDGGSLTRRGQRIWKLFEKTFETP